MCGKRMTSKLKRNYGENLCGLLATLQGVAEVPHEVIRQYIDNNRGLIDSAKGQIFISSPWRTRS